MSGKVTRLSQGIEHTHVSYDGLTDPLSVALKWERSGAHGLHLVDLDAAFGNGDNTNIIYEIVDKVSLPVQVGGGIRNFDIACSHIENGVSKIILGTAAVKNPSLIKKLLQKYDPNQIIIALDHKSGKVMIKGWRTDSGESLINLTKNFLAQNLNQILVTSIKRDGMLKGPDLDVISNLLSLNKIKVIASGGVRNLNDIISLKNMDVHAVIVGKAIYTGTLNLSDAIKLVGDKSGSL